MKASPTLQLHIGDRLKELMPILPDNEAVGAWLKAAFYLWEAGPSPAERVGLAVGSGWVRVGFLLHDENGVVSMPWMEEKRAEQVAFRTKQVANGRKGGRPRVLSVKDKNPGLSSGITQTKAKKSPRVRNMEYGNRSMEDGRWNTEIQDGGQGKEVHVAEVEPTFAQFWNLYAKGSKKLSEVEWHRLTHQEHLEIMANVPAYQASKSEFRFRKDGERFLKLRTWEDPIVNPNNNGQRSLKDAQADVDRLIIDKYGMPGSQDQGRS